MSRMRGEKIFYKGIAGQAVLEIGVVGSRKKVILSTENIPGKFEWG